AQLTINLTYLRTLRHTPRLLPPSPPSHLPPLFFFFHATPPTATYTLSLHDALPISSRPSIPAATVEEWAPYTFRRQPDGSIAWRSEEHTSELQSPYDLVCRLLLEKKKKIYR